jgi:trans-2,3-dihydro-3-hydroxyanthranilate isomerase
VFTSERLTGNQLAVVHDADALDDRTMLAFARETRLSETTFVQRPVAEGADYRNRIWTTRGELPFAGHPSLGTAVAVALARGERSARYVQETGAGLQPVDVEVGDGGVARASMLSEPASFGASPGQEDVAAAAGLEPGDLDAGLPAQVVSTGLDHVIAPVRRGALERVRPDHGRLDALLTATGTVVLYLVEVSEEGWPARARSFFADPLGVTEDPATGSAAGPLLAYLHARRGSERLVVEQGAEMGRASRLECTFDEGRVRVGGHTVVVASGTVEL